MERAVDEVSACVPLARAEVWWPAARRDASKYLELLRRLGEDVVAKEPTTPFVTDLEDLGTTQHTFHTKVSCAGLGRLSTGDVCSTSRT